MDLLDRNGRVARIIASTVLGFVTAVLITDAASNLKIEGTSGGAGWFWLATFSFTWFFSTMGIHALLTGYAKGHAREHPLPRARVVLRGPRVQL